MLHNFSARYAPILKKMKKQELKPLFKGFLT